MADHSPSVSGHFQWRVIYGPSARALTDVDLFLVPVFLGDWKAERIASEVCNTSQRIGIISYKGMIRAMNCAGPSVLKKLDIVPRKKLMNCCFKNNKRLSISRILQLK